MKDFEKFILRHHPDPDHLLKDQDIYDSFIRLSELYAESKILDIKNWLKSELEYEQHPKLTKTLNNDRIQLLLQIINKL